MPLLITLPFLTSFLLLMLLSGWATHQTSSAVRWPRPLLWTTAFTGLFIALSSEFLSLLKLLNLYGLAAVWSIALSILIYLGAKTGFFREGIHYWLQNINASRSWDRMTKGLLGLLGLEMLLLLLVALAAAPNTADSLLYHMSRVSHWLQNQSLQHYAAAYNHQLWSPIFSENAILHLDALWGSDRPANLVQFSSMLASLAAVAGITRLLGGKQRTQILAVLLAFSAPMALLQSTSTQTDYVVALWSLSTLYFMVRLILIDLTPVDWLAMGASVGLGMLTKVTFYPFMGFLLVGGFVLAWRRGRPVAQLVRWGLIAAGVAVILNAGYWSRNIKTYGTPLGARDMLASNTNLSLDPRTPISNGLQHLLLNFTTPWPGINEEVEALANSFASTLGQSSASFEILWGWNHEDLAGNPIHVTLLVAASGLALLPGPEAKRVRWYAAGIFLSLLAFAWTVDVGVHRVRYQVPWLLMGAPLIARVLSYRVQRHHLSKISGVLLVLALPWILFNQTRPAVGWPPRTRTDSVFLISRSESLFANASRARQPFTEAAKAATADNCQQVGLSIDPIDIEYTFWWLLERIEPDVEIQIVRPLPELRHLQDGNFIPCAIICTNCQQDRFNGLDLEATFGPARVYRADP